MELQWYVGIDWGKQQHQVCLLDHAGQPCAQYSIPHTGQGFLNLTNWLSEHTGAADTETIGVVLETSTGPVVECCQAGGYTVYAINPKQADRFRDRFSPAGAKDDRRDALVLATALFLEPQALRLLETAEGSSIEFREQSRMRVMLLQTRTRTILKIQQFLWRYYPQFALLFGSDLALPFVAALWHRMPNPQQAQRTRKSTVEAILNKHHIRRLDAQEVLTQLRTEPLPVSAETATSVQENLALLWQQLTLIGQQLQELERQLAARLEQLKTESTTLGDPLSQTHSDPDILASIPGVGMMVLATLLGEAGTAIRNRNYAALRCLTGIAPVTKKSGYSYRVRRRRSANPRLVDSMYHWARVASQHDAKCRQRYEALRARGHSHGRALRSVADRLLFVACAMLKNGTLYQQPANET